MIMNGTKFFPNIKSIFIGHCKLVGAPIWQGSYRVRKVLGQISALAAALSLGVSGCTDDALLLESGDFELAHMAAESSDAAPFYYYQGEPVALEVEPTELVIVSRLPDAIDVARQVLSEVGVVVGADQELPQAPGHRLLSLPASTTRGRALEARDRLRADPRFEFVAVGYRTQDEGAKVMLLNRVAVSFREDVSRAQIERLAAQLGVRVVREPNPSQGSFHHWLEYGAGTDPLVVAAALDRHPLVEWADPDKVSDRKPQYIPTDGFFAQQYYLRNSSMLNGVRVDINAIHAWDLTTGAWAPSSGGFRVAVVDDGVERNHPDFGGRVLLGYDAFGEAWNYGEPDIACHDVHGTMVTGTILMEHNNTAGGAGTAPGVLVIPIRIFRCGLPASDSQTANALNYAWQVQDAQVLNNSWAGGAASNAITDAINSGNVNGRGGRGSVFVFAAGNTSDRSAGVIGSVLYPATLDSVVAVGAINRNGQVTNYSPEGSTLDLVAPSGQKKWACADGADVVSTDLLGWHGCSDGPSGNIDYTSRFTGTSAAAPQVAGVFSLLLAREPTLTSSQAKTRVYNAADPWGTSSRFGRGKVNAYRTLVGRLSAYISGPSYIRTTGYYTWTAVTSGGQQTPQYLWERSLDGEYYWSVSTSQSYSTEVWEGDSFYLRLTVTQGPDDARVFDSQYVDSPQSCIVDC